MRQLFHVKLLFFILVLSEQFSIKAMSSGQSIFETWQGAYQNSNLQKDAINFRTPTTLWGAAQKKYPKPTNRWFTTLTIRRPDKPVESNETFPVNVFPYILNLTNQGIQMGYQDKKTVTPDHDHVLTVFLNNFEIAAVEQFNLSRRIVSSVVNEPFSVTFKWGDEHRNMVAPLVHGMPFVTVELTNVTPKFSTMHAILDINGKGSSGSGVGTKYKIRMNNGQTWFLFTSAPLALNWNGSSLIAHKPFTGVIRMIEYAVPADFTQHQKANRQETQDDREANRPALESVGLLQALDLANALKFQDSKTSFAKSGSFDSSFQIAPPLPPSPADLVWASQLSTVDAFQKRFFKQDLPALKLWYETTYEKQFDKSIELHGETPLEMYRNYVEEIYNPLLKQWEKDKQIILGGTKRSSVVLGRLSESQPGVEELIERYKDAYPVSGSVQFDVQGDKARIIFNWKTKGSGELLMLCLPHHRDILQNPRYVQDIVYDSIRGQMVGVVGTSWVLQETLPTIGWNAVSDISVDKIPAIKEALKKDQFFKAGAADSYSFGKEVAKMLRLALIAHQLKEHDIAKSILFNAKEALEPWVKGTNVDKIVYDSQWGGVCTVDGMQDAGADYGLGWYNDHHFHWGYFIYAAGAFIHLIHELQISSEFQNFVSELIPCMHDLIRDIANPKADASYPDHRFMDWYLGHTLASGLFPFGDGKNQESTSEAVNAWYGIYLFGMATKNKELEQLGKILAATEIRGAHTYWQMKPDSKIYPKEFAARTCVGILWEMKADYATWFGANVEYIHLIQYLPFTPITELLIPKAWNSLQYPLLEKALTRKDPVIMEEWKGYLYMSQAISNPQAGWKNIQSLNAYDNGNTKTNALYWAATRR